MTAPPHNSSGGAIVEIMDTRTGRVLEQFKSSVSPSALALSPDARLVAIAGWRNNRGGTEIWDRKERRSLWALDTHSENASTVAFSPDGKLLATGSWDGTSRIWDPATGKELAVLIGHKAALLRCEFTPDSRTLATAGDDFTIKLWHMATFREVSSFPVGPPAFFLRFSPDGQMLAHNGTEKRDIRILHAPKAQEESVANRNPASHRGALIESKP